MKKTPFVIILFFYLSGFAQTTDNLSEDNTSMRFKDFAFTLSGNSFVINNEFFNGYVEGYTLIGYNFNPGISYKISDKLEVNAGVHLLKYSGLDSYSKYLPQYSLIFSDGKSLLRLGTLNSRQNHNTPSFILDEEKVYTNLYEEGIEYILSGNNLSFNSWINWEYFIFHNDPNPEWLTFGTSGKYKIMEKENSRLEIPFYLLARHRGGQIDTSNVNIQTLTHSSVGLSYIKKINSNTLEITNNTVFYNDNSPVTELKYDSGFGNLTRVCFSTQKYSYSLDYWYANSFINPLGNPMYNCISQDTMKTVSSSRSLLIPTFSVDIYKYQNSIISFYAQGYYDLSENTFDYAMGLYISLNID